MVREHIGCAECIHAAEPGRDRGAPGGASALRADLAAAAESDRFGVVFKISRFNDPVMFSGVALAVSGMLVVLVAESAARGKLGLNAGAGIRIPSVMKSAEAWRTGHRAARVWLDCGGVTLGAGGLVAAPGPRWLGDPGIIAAMAVGLCLIVLGSGVARRAALRCGERPDEDGQGDHTGLW